MCAEQAERGSFAPPSLDPPTYTASFALPHKSAPHPRLGITPTYNATYGEYHFSYTSGGVLHTVSYEAPQSIAAEEAIVRQYGLGGPALWTIGGEQPSFWTAINGG